MPQRCTRSSASTAKPLTRIVVHGTPNHGAAPQVASRQGRRYVEDDPYRERFDDYDRCAAAVLLHAPPLPTPMTGRTTLRLSGADSTTIRPQQRRYVQRGLFNSYGGYGY